MCLIVAVNHTYIMYIIHVWPLYCTACPPKSRPDYEDGQDSCLCYIGYYEVSDNAVFESTFLEEGYKDYEDFHNGAVPAGAIPGCAKCPVWYPYVFSMRVVCITLMDEDGYDMYNTVYTGSLACWHMFTMWWLVWCLLSWCTIICELGCVCITRLVRIARQLEQPL